MQLENIPGAWSVINQALVVVGSFFALDNTCEICRSGYQSSHVHLHGDPAPCVATSLN